MKKLAICLLLCLSCNLSFAGFNCKIQFKDGTIELAPVRYEKHHDIALPYFDSDTFGFESKLKQDHVTGEYYLKFDHWTVVDGVENYYTGRILLSSSKIILFSEDIRLTCNE